MEDENEGGEEWRKKGVGERKKRKGQNDRENFNTVFKTLLFGRWEEHGEIPSLCKTPSCPGPMIPRT